MQINDAIWSVSALNFEIKTMLEKGIGSIWIEGEISNLAKPASGHWYFSLKDDRAQVRAAMFKNRNGRVAFTPGNGQQVLVRAQVTLYVARGDFQLIIDHMEEAGIGRLMQQYEALKRKLKAEGLFAESHKKQVPHRANRIGVITSASGAAIRDVLSVIERRSPTSEIIVYPTPVQGDQATAKIVEAIQSANRHAACDVLLLVRGGGSLEDLWCFNEESVAYAIYNSTLPVVSGIGHEIDFTIADFVADARAPTPSVAAESVTMDQYEVMTQLDIYTARLVTQMHATLQQATDSLHTAEQRLLRYHPTRSLQTISQRLQFARVRLLSSQHNQLQKNKNELQLLHEQLKHLSPQNTIPLYQKQLISLQHQLLISMVNRLDDRKHQFTLQARSLDNFSPLKTLARGYATVSKNNCIINSIDQLKPDDKIDIQLQDGKCQAQITSAKIERQENQ